MLIWTLEGHALETLRAALEGARTLRVAVDGGDFKYKVNEGAWAADIEPDENGLGTSAHVPELPECSIHGTVWGTGGATAQFDGKTVQGPWAFMCDACFLLFGVGLGTGRGQRLIVDPRNG